MYTNSLQYVGLSLMYTSSLLYVGLSLMSAVCMYAIVLVHIDLPNEIVLYAAADPGFLKGGV